MTTVTISQARASLPDLLTRVEQGDEITITRHGRAVAVLARPEVLHRRTHVLTENLARIAEFGSAAAEPDLSIETGLTLKRAEQLIGAIRADREHR